MQEIILGVGMFTLIVLVLVAVIMFAKSKLVPPHQAALSAPYRPYQ